MQKLPVLTSALFAAQLAAGVLLFCASVAGIHPGWACVCKIVFFLNVAFVAGTRAYRQRTSCGATAVLQQTVFLATGVGALGANSALLYAANLYMAYRYHARHGAELK